MIVSHQTARRLKLAIGLLLGGTAAFGAAAFDPYLCVERYEGPERASFEQHPIWHQEF